MSEQTRLDTAKYKKNKAEYQLEHPNCEMPGCTRSLLKGDVIDLHHKAGRNGPLRYCKKYFCSACRTHHNWVKENQSEARAIGWIIDVSSEEVRQLRLEELMGEGAPVAPTPPEQDAGIAA